MSAQFDRAGRLVLSGTIGDGFFGEDAFAYDTVVRALAEVDDSDTLTVVINSGGGNAFDGLALHSLFKARAGRTEIVGQGVVASAASVAALGGDSFSMAAGAVYMLHDPSALTMGTAEDHGRSIAALETLSRSYADVYAARTKRPVDEMRSLMRAETWLDAKEAVALGFADAVTEHEVPKAAAPFPYAAYAHPPQRLAAMASVNGWRVQEGDAAAEQRRTWRAGWASAVAAVNQRRGNTTEGATRAPAAKQSGWADVVAEVNRSRGGG